MDQFTNNAHIDKLECIVVHGTMPSFPNSAYLSLATPTICAILLMLVTARFFVNGDGLFTNF